MDPVTGMVVVGAAGALAQAYQAEQANRANKARLKEIRELFEKITPPEYNMSVMDPPELINRTIPTSAYDFSEIQPKEFQLVGQYSPETLPYIAEQNPTLLTKTAETREGRDAQLNALRQLRQISESGTNPELENQLGQASRSAQIAAQARQQSILQDANRRGQMGSGVSLAAQLSGASDAMERASMESQNAAAEAYRQRLSALRDSASLGGQMEDREMSQQKSNADIINAFNQRAATRQQDLSNMNVGNRNDAQMSNLRAAQTIADRNVGAMNDAQRYNRDRNDRLLDSTRSQEVAERSYQNQLRQSSADWRRSEIDNKNNLMNRAYQDQINRASGMSGIGQMEMQNNSQTARDRNAAIQGVSDVGLRYMQNNANQQQRADDRAYDQKKTRYEQTGDDDVWK